MVELKDIAKKIENILNTNTLGKTFRIFSDSGELAKRNGHENEYRNGLVEIVSSTISNLSGLQFINMSVNLTLYANEEARGKDSDGNSIEIIELRQVLGDFLDSYNFKTFAEEFGEATYSTTYVIGATTTLPKGSLGYINDCVPLVTNIGLTFFENGVNSNEWQIFIDGEEVGYTSAVISRTKTAENQPLVESKSTKSVMQTNGFGLDLVVPQISNNLGNAIENEILTGQEYAHMLYIKGKNTEQNYICVFGNLQASLIKNANVGFNVPLVEGVPELLEYEEYKWLNLEVEVTDLSYNTVTILNNDSENLHIIWGDEHTTYSNFVEIQHTYRELGTYTITLYNKNATDSDWTEAIIRDYLELDKFTYTAEDNEITITKVNAPATTYNINGTYYIDNVVNEVVEVGSGAGAIDSNVVNIVLPDTIKKINSKAFETCTSLTEITIPNSVTSIGSKAFRYCSSLTSIMIPDSVTSIGTDAFEGCSSLSVLDLSDTSLDTINSSTFFGCSGLSNISLPGTIEIIGSSAFAYCTSLESISLPVSLKSIQQAAFAESGITSLYIHSGIQTILSSAFARCVNLATIYVHENNQYFKADGNKALLDKNGTIFKQYALNHVSAFSYTTPPGVWIIDFYAFAGSPTLRELVLSSGVQIISNFAIAYCPSLESLTLPSGLTSIGSYAIQNCSSLESINIPSSVTNIGDWALYGCSSLTSITLNSTTPPVIGWDTFSNTNNCPIYVPMSSVNDYKTATNWTHFASRVTGV